MLLLRMHRKEVSSFILLCLTQCNDILRRACDMRERTHTDFCVVDASEDLAAACWIEVFTGVGMIG